MFHSFQCHFFSVPSAPKIVDGNAGVTATVIPIAWSQLPHDFVKGFNISATYTGPCTNFNMTIKMKLHYNRRQFNITNLQEHSTYFIVLTAFNDAGSNSTNVTISTTTSGEYIIIGSNLKTVVILILPHAHIAPDEAPTSVQVNYVNLTCMEISWKPLSCIRQNSVIKGYSIHYWKISGSRLSNKSIETSVDVTNVVACKLIPSTKYMVEVQAVNEKGSRGPAYELIVNTTSPKGMQPLQNAIGSCV